MNPLLSFIFERRSIRRYKDKPVPESMIRDLLEAAMAAPSAVAKDPWHFFVVTAAETRQRMAEALPNGQMLRQAPLGILVCGDLDKAHDRQESYLIQDCSAAVENLLLASTALGLGACWLGVHPRPDRIAHMRSLFKLGNSLVPLAVIAVGWPDEVQPARTRYTPSAVHREQN